MAVVELNLSALNLEVLPTALYALGQAINERITILRGTGISFSPSIFYGRWLPEEYSPNYAAEINNITHYVFNLSKYFVDLDVDYISNSYTNFPKTLNGALVAESQDVFTKNVSVGETFTRDTMENFKSILSNAAMWINKMTCVVPSNTYTTQEWSETKSWTINNADTLSNKTAAFDNPVSTDLKRGNMTITIEDSSNQTFFDGDVISYYGDRSITANTGLIIDNRTPYNAEVKNFLVLPAVSESAWSSIDKWQHIAKQILMCGNIWQVDDYALPGQVNNTFQEQGLIGNELRVLQDYSRIVDYSSGKDYGDDNYQLAATVDETKYNYNWEGSQSITLDHSHEEFGEDKNATWYSDPNNEINIYGTALWFGLGMWSAIGQPYVTSIPAHTMDYAINPLSAIEKPEEDWHRFDDGYSRGLYDWREQYTFTYKMRVVPILDFTESITTFSGV